MRPEGAAAPGESVVWLDFLDELGAALAGIGAPYDAYACNANFRGSAAVSGSEVMSVLGHNVVLVRRDRGIVVEDARTGGFVSALDISTGMEGLTFNVARGWGWAGAGAIAHAMWARADGERVAKGWFAVTELVATAQMRGPKG